MTVYGKRREAFPYVPVVIPGRSISPEDASRTVIIPVDDDLQTRASTRPRSRKVTKDERRIIAVALALCLIADGVALLLAWMMSR